MGLNLMHETRLGLARHRSPYDKAHESSFNEQNCSLEGQVANVADRIAYNCHDLEDGMRAGLISREALRSIGIFAEAQERINAEAIDDRTIRRTRTAKAIMNKLVGDCLETSGTNLAEADIKAVGDIYTMSESLITLSSRRDDELAELERFLMQNFYRHRSLVETADKVSNWLQRLFEELCRDPKRMPGYFQHFIPQQGLQRTVCDYIAGMTDRFCLKMLDKISRIHPLPPTQAERAPTHRSKLVTQHGLTRPWPSIFEVLHSMPALGTAVKEIPTTDCFSYFKNRKCAIIEVCGTPTICVLSLREKRNCHVQPKRLHAHRTPGRNRSNRHTNGHSDARPSGRQGIGARCELPGQRTIPGAGLYDVRRR